ncbi:type VI secretion system Vgr family protein [Massilia agri]|uniref:Type VI secretion system tip protein VgrG n=1 Tax=Massilia agri TaxID=1886785 RepID=A0ABT2AQY6_9BURK|nr:type VI secretion system Vgr family protein [Massilia agri]MCS0598113.1 type VI secretion system tip protein VgrG [Massilia agri]
MTSPIASLASAVLESLAGRYAQHRRVLKLTTPLGEDVLLAESLRGSEGLSEGFRFEVAALSLDAAIPLKALIGQPVLLELLTDGFGQNRNFHGHVTSAELNGANGGFARYRLVIEPWTRFLSLGRDSRVFQDMSVPDILDTVFRSWDSRGKLAPAWRFELADPGVYPKRSITTQYQESDFAFAERLMSEEGQFYFFEHGAECHTLVIADHNGAFVPNQKADVRFTQPGAVMREDSVDRWRIESKLQTNAVELASWDYRSRGLRAVTSSALDAIALPSRDLPGVYAYASRAHGQRIADRQLEALQAEREVHVGAGTVRSFVPGTTFTLHEHSRFDGNEDAAFTLVRVRHLAHNNLDADTGNALARLLGQCLLRKENEEELGSNLHAAGREPGTRPVYRNRFEAIPSRVPYRARRTDGHGALLHPRPVVQGQQTAIVVGPSGSVIHTDRDHRIKVQFHWQRGDASHSRLPHPSPDGHTGAPADDTAGTWVRVATPLAPVAGANWGSHALPRVGQEVLVDFLDGNIDRPVVIGAVYNGAGQPDAQSNQVVQGGGAATGNAPAWFPGEGGAHAHPAVLSGLKSQALQASQQGNGAYSQLVFDDTPQQARVALQRHAKAHEGHDELNLGHLRHQTDNQRLGPSGFGAELKSAHTVAVRAGAGMLLATDVASGADAHLESSPAAMQIESAKELMTDLASTAQKHKAQIAGEGKAEELSAVRDVQHSLDTIQVSSGAVAVAGEGGMGSAASFGEAQLQLAGPMGIAALTPASAVLAAGASTAITAGQDIDIAAQANLYHAVKAGISVFTYGKAQAASKPNTETGIRLHSASGKFSAQSQTGPTRITADRTITVASVTRSVTVAAKDTVLLTAQGAYLKLTGGNIEVHGPGKMAFRAGMKELTGPRSSTPVLPQLPKPGQVKNFMELNYRWDDLQPMVGAPYMVLFDDGTSVSGKLDAYGHARLENVPTQRAQVFYGEDEREAVPRKQPKSNAVFGAKATTDDEAQRLIAQYLAQEAEHYKSNFFPDEIERMANAVDGEGDVELEYDYHVHDYLYDDEDSADARDGERSYRDIHGKDEGEQA